MSKDNNFELFLSIKAENDRLSLEKSVNEYKKKLGNIEMVQGGAISDLVKKEQENPLGSLFSKFNLGLTGATAALYKLKQMGDKVIETQNKVYKEEGEKARRRRRVSRVL